MPDSFTFPEQPDLAPTSELTAEGAAIYINRVKYTYRPSFPELIVPVGFKTDILSAPHPLWWVFPPDDFYRPAALIHDMLYGGQGKLTLADGTVWTYSRAEADDYLLEIMTRLEIPPWKRFLAWAAVRLFGGSHWGPG